MPERTQAVALIAAAGSGSRLGAGGPKALVECAGRPLIAWSLDAFEACRTVQRVVIAAPPGRLDEFRSLAGGGVDVVAGGAARSESVAAALAAIDEDEATVVVHDAARPFVGAELIDACVERLGRSHNAAGVIAAAPVTDTVKRAAASRADDEAESRRVSATEDREFLWAAQTPQVFRVRALREALATSPERLAAASDDAMLVEEAGGVVLIEPAPAANLKVTTAADLVLAASLLARR